MKLYLLLLGAEVPGRSIEQHDYFFGIADNLKDLVEEVRAFWPEAGNSLHIDGWREMTRIDNYAITVVQHTDETPPSANKLFFFKLRRLYRRFVRRAALYCINSSGKPGIGSTSG